MSEFRLKRDSAGTSLEQIKCKYRVVYKFYVDCLSSINDRLVMMSSKVEEASTGHSFHVPPCDIEIFFGDYLKWPSFRDLFTAVYVNNSRLSKVEKLFYLNSKTISDAKDIVSKAP